MKTNTKIFCDIAKLDEIKKFNKKKIVKGFTTNPSLMRKAGAKNYENYSKQILKICTTKPESKQILLIIILTNLMKLLRLIHGEKMFMLRFLFNNSKGIFMGRIIKELNKENIKLDVILFHLFQLDL